MADPINRLAMFSAPVGEPVNHLAQATLPAGHPSNMLMWLRDQIPAVQADDSSLTSGIASRVGRTATGIPRSALETMANWLQGTHDPNAVRIGPDTLAPLGAGAMVSGVINKLARPSHDWRMAQDLMQKHPDAVAGGDMYTTGARVGVDAGDGNRAWAPGELERASDSARHLPISMRPANQQYGPHAVMADNAKSSTPGLAANSTQPEDDGVMSILRRYGLHD